MLRTWWGVAGLFALSALACGIAFVSAVVAEQPASAEAVSRMLPVRGLHVSGGNRADLDLCEKFIREALPAEGVNLLVWEVDYDYAYGSYPQVGNAQGLTRADAQRLLTACRQAGVKLVPQINCLGHQSWHEHKGGLLRAFPQFDETPWILDSSRDFYCRSYCPLHPELHKVLFALIDEVAEACEATDFHVGMDEVFFVAEKQCPRCGGKSPAEVFAGEVKALHDHLAAKGRSMWMWGDRFIDGAATGLGDYEASANGTYPAVDAVPKDVIICDWHYDRAPSTPAYFVEKGFRVVACPWRDESVALKQLEMVRELRKTSERALGMLQTTWCGFGEFVRAYYGQGGRRDAAGAARCFKALFAAIRAEQSGGAK